MGVEKGIEIRDTEVAISLASIIKALVNVGLEWLEADRQGRIFNRWNVSGLCGIAADESRGRKISIYIDRKSDSKILRELFLSVFINTLGPPPLLPPTHPSAYAPAN